MRVGVIFGGRSVEHDVSIVTAHQLMAVLSSRHQVVPIYISREGVWYTGEALNDLAVYKSERWGEVGDEAILPPIHGFGGLSVGGGRLKPARKIGVDVVVPAVHGTYGEDGTLQGLLELAGLPYVGSGVTASAVGMDKVAMKAVFRGAGLPVVEDAVVDVDSAEPLEAAFDRVEDKLGYPCFVKPVKAGSSVGIGKATDRLRLAELVDVASRYDHRVLIERAVEDCIEINCSVLGGGRREPRASVCEQPIAWQDYLSFEDKYLRGGKAESATKGSADGGMASLDRRIPAPISEESTKQVQENALAAYRAIGAAGVARIDAFLNEETGETCVMEINTVPGSFAFYLWEATGVSFAELSEEILEIALERHLSVGQRLFTFDSGVLAAAGGSKASG